MMSVSTNTSEQDPAASRKLEKDIQSSSLRKDVNKPPEDLVETAIGDDSQNASENRNQLRNQAKESLHSSTPNKKQRRDSIRAGAGVSYSSVLSLMPSRMSLRTLITPQVRFVCCYYVCG
jgi:hypothetical protein